MALIIIRIFSASFGMLRLATERIWKHVDDGNGRKFVIIMLLQKEMRVTQATRFAFLHENTCKSRLS